MDTSRRSSTSDDDEQQAQHDRANKEVLDAIQLGEGNTDGLHKLTSPDAQLEMFIKHLEEKYEKENESLRNEIDEKKVKLEAANADIDAMIDIAEQENEVLRTTFALKLRSLMMWVIYVRILDMTAIEDETWLIVQLLVDIRDARARQYQANLQEIRRLQAEIEAEDEGYSTPSSSESSSED